MSQIKINVNDVRTENKAFKRMIGRIDDERKDLLSLRHRIDSSITGRRNIDSRLSQAGSKLNDLQTRLQALYNLIDYGMDAYIQADDKAKDHPFEKKKKKSIWNKIGSAIHAVGDGITGFVEGLADAVIGTVEGIVTMVVHPIQTFQGIVFVATHPVAAAKGIWTAVSESWNNEVVNGDAESRGKWFGRMVGEVALSVVGTKGVDKVGKIAKGSKLLKEAGGVRIVPDALKSKLPKFKRKTGAQETPEIKNTPPRVPKEENVTPPRSSKAEDGTGKVDIQRISEIEIEFKRNPKHDKAEFERQLKAQEEGINSLTVEGFIKNRDRYLKDGRALEGDAAQKLARQEALKEKITELRKQGLSREEANKRAEEWLKEQAALHNPDQIAGGRPDKIGGLGDKGINSSIGSQWKSKISGLDNKIRETASKMTKEERESTFLNIKLKN